MTYGIEDENGMLRVTLEFLSKEEPKVINVLQRILCDYKNSYESLWFSRDRDKKKTWNTEFYIRKSDEDRAYRLLGKLASVH